MNDTLVLYLYLETIQSLLVENDIDTIIPMTEPELQVISPLARELGINRCITSGEKVIEVGVDKLATIDALKELGLPVPWTYLAQDRLPDTYPCILKTRFGTGSRTVFVINDRTEAQTFVEKYPEAIFQEILEPADREITCAVYRSDDERVTSLVMLRRLIGGYTGWAKVIDDDSASQMCETIAKGLNLRGSMNIQMRLTSQGPRVFEINPRFSSTVLMRHRIGFSDVLWALDEAECKDLIFPKCKPNQILVRVQDASVL